MNARTFGYVVSEMRSGTPDGPKRGAIGRIANVLQKRSFVRREMDRRPPFQDKRGYAPTKPLGNPPRPQDGHTDTTAR